MAVPSWCLVAGVLLCDAHAGADANASLFADDDGLKAACEVSMWSPWKWEGLPVAPASLNVSGSCQPAGKQRQVRQRHSLSPHAPPGACPKLIEQRHVKFRSCVGNGASHICGTRQLPRHLPGEAPAGGSRWVPYQLPSDAGGKVIANAVVLRIDATVCAFRATPQYSVVLVNADKDPYFQGLLRGGSSVVQPHKGGFDVVLDCALLAPEVSAVDFAAMANSIQLGITWAGDMGSNSGRTADGETGWKLAAERLPVGRGDKAKMHLISVDVDVSGNAFQMAIPDPKVPKRAWAESLPAVFSSVVGAATAGHWRVASISTSWLKPSTGPPTHVRVTALAPTTVTPHIAEALGWSIAFFGSASATSGRIVNPQWVLDPSRTGVLYSSSAPVYTTAVRDSSRSPFPAVYLVSLSMASDSQTASDNDKGGVALTLKQFEFLAGALPYPPVLSVSSSRTLHYGAWGFNASVGLGCAWSSSIYRAVAPAPMVEAWTVQYTQVNLAPSVAVNCHTSQWSVWSACTGNLCTSGKRSRKRFVVTKGTYGGDPCGTLEHTKDCQTPCEGSGSSVFCGGTQPSLAPVVKEFGLKGHIGWKRFDSSTWYQDIKFNGETQARCKFSAALTVPVYVVSFENQLSADSACPLALENLMPTVNLVVASEPAPTRAGFRVWLQRGNVPEKELAAIVDGPACGKWQVSWIGATGEHAGIETPGATNFKPFLWQPWGWVDGDCSKLRADQLADF